MASSDGNDKPGRARLPANNPDLTRLLFREEERFVTGDFRGYFLTKRFNFIATINNFPDISDLYFRTDQNWLEAIEQLGDVRNGDWIVPTQLTIFCFREIRLAAELLFCCCTTPGYSHLRTAIESFAQAQKILREPALSRVWLSRDVDRGEYDKYFKNNLKANLFPDNSGFAPLHGVWKMLCDAGPHPNVTSLGVSSSATTVETTVHWRLEFFEVDLGEITKNLLLMIKWELEMFKHSYSAFHERLSLRPHLLTNLQSQLVDFAGVGQKYVPKEPPSG